MASDVSILKPRGYMQKTSCGYCKNGTGGANYYMSCDNMRVDHYQELIDRGWRRSGHLYYKPDLSRACCPQYTIRLDAADFKAKKSQRQAINRWNYHVLGHQYMSKEKILCPVPREEKRRKRDVFDVTAAVRAAEYSNLSRPTSLKTKMPIDPDHRLEVVLEPDTFTTEKYDVFLRYQLIIHKDPESRWAHADFKRFLCDGLNQRSLKIDGKSRQFGSYHQCYRLDGNLVAVGVLDLLPHGLSSVYLFYDPDFGQWEFGKLSALREISLAIEGNYQHYYMGFYIHSCVKMRYKAGFQPSYLLDPESLAWNPLNKELSRKLDKNRYVCPSRETKMESENENVLESESQPLNSSKPEHVTENATSEDLQIDPDSDDEDEAEVPEGSLFEYQVPGVLSKEEVSKLDLAHWKMMVRKHLVDLEDLRGWESWKIDEPYSIKGIAAELAATIGPNLLEGSAISLF